MPTILSLVLKSVSYSDSAMIPLYCHFFLLKIQFHSYIKRGTGQKPPGRKLPGQKPPERKPPGQKPPNKEKYKLMFFVPYIFFSVSLFNCSNI